MIKFSSNIFRNNAQIQVNTNTVINKTITTFSTQKCLKRKAKFFKQNHNDVGIEASILKQTKPTKAV